MKSKILLGLAFIALWACDNGNDVTKPSDDSLSETSSSSAQESQTLSSSSVVEQSSATVDEPSSSLSFSQNEVRSSSSAVQAKSSSSAKVYTNYDPVTGILTDERDGEKYKTAKIGDQIWMAQNLRLEKPHFGVECTKDYCDYNIKDSATIYKYGHHYSWYLATQVSCEYDEKFALSGTASVLQTPVQGICPTGWHIPTIAEWQELFNAAPLIELLSTDWQEKYFKGTDVFGLSLNAANEDVENIPEFLALDETASTENAAVVLYCMDPTTPVKVESEMKRTSFTYLRCLKD